MSFQTRMQLPRLFVISCVALDDFVLEGAREHHLNTSLLLLRIYLNTIDLSRFLIQQRAQLRCEIQDFIALEGRRIEATDTVLGGNLAN